MRKDILAGLIGNGVGAIGGGIINCNLHPNFALAVLIGIIFGGLGFWIGFSTNRVIK